MKRTLLAIVAVLMMAGGSFAATTVSACLSSWQSVAMRNLKNPQPDDENVMDRFIAIINDYAKKIKTAKSKDEVKNIAFEFASAVTVYEKNNKTEIEALESLLTEAQKKEYEKVLAKAMAELKAVVEAKQEEFGM